MAHRIQFHTHGEANVLEYAEYSPKDPEPNEVQVANKAIGINYIDTYFRSGLYPVSAFPSGLGTEASGIVEKIGSEVTDIKVGDRVVYAQSSLGAYSEYHNVPAKQIAKLPDSISFEQAAASFLKGLTVYYLFYMTYPVQSGETILFHAAAGGVGSIACQWAKSLGVNLIGTVGSAEKAALAKKLGAWATIDYQKEDIAKRVLELTEGKKVGVSYDSVGKSTWEASLNSVRPRGLIVSFGNASGPVTGVDLGILNQKGCLYVTRPSVFGYITNKELLQQAADELFSRIASGEINVDVASSQVFKLKDAELAHKTLEGRQTTGSSLLIP